MIRSPIKWTGSKFQYAEKISERLFPTKYYYEPFLGGGSVFIKVLYYQMYDTYIVSDLNPSVVFLWNLIKDDHYLIFKSYLDHWMNLKKDTDYYYRIREQYNEDKDPLKFFFLVRTCSNGLIRFNKVGNFNASLHKNKNGINPRNLEKMLVSTKFLLDKNKVEMFNIPYDVIDYDKESILYLDPPHINSSLMPGDEFNYDKFISFLIKKNSNKYKYAITLSGQKGKNSYAYNLNKDLYVSKEIFCKRHSYFDNLNKNKRGEELFYANYKIGWYEKNYKTKK